jgi:hypothetical protein
MQPPPLEPEPPSPKPPPPLPPKAPIPEPLPDPPPTNPIPPLNQIAVPATKTFLDPTARNAACDKKNRGAEIEPS